jgi:hypothetical protein
MTVAIMVIRRRLGTGILLAATGEFGATLRHAPTVVSMVLE